VAAGKGHDFEVYRVFILRERLAVTDYLYHVFCGYEGCKAAACLYELDLIRSSVFLGQINGCVCKLGNFFGKRGRISPSDYPFIVCYGNAVIKPSRNVLDIPHDLNGIDDISHNSLILVLQWLDSKVVAVSPGIGNSLVVQSDVKVTASFYLFHYSLDETFPK
jgi:hypothetical protein